jgi:DUF1009 family protein
MKTLMMIAGRGEFPLQVARGALGRGLHVLGFGLQGEASPELAVLLPEFHWVEAHGVDSFLSRLAAHRGSQITLAGGVYKLNWLELFLKNRDLFSTQAEVEHHGDAYLLNQLGKFFQTLGIEVVDPLEYLEARPPSAGDLTSRSLTPEQIEDVKIGFQIAKVLGYHDIGQTTVVKNKVVLAVEGIEGTDQAILRGGHLGGAGVVVVKAAKPGQDLRFDRPVVGLKTIQTLLEVKAAVLAVEAEKVLILDQQTCLCRAEQQGLAIVARQL